jgi:diadenosine tetraphosphatase ApaH/serine/threonine PP2A family protein phosphatase
MSSTRYALLGDVHSNWEALSAVLEDCDAHGLTEFVCVGDLVGYNADPAPCLDRIRGLTSQIVCGNHDHYCSHNERLDDFHPLAANVVDWTRGHLTDGQLTYLRGLPLTRRVGGFSIVHSTMDMPEKWGYVFDSLDAESHFNYQITAVCFYGHTHAPVVFEKHSAVQRIPYGKMTLDKGRKYFVNVGSVGQPRDGDPRAAYAIYDTASRELELRRVTYDLQKTQAKIRKAGLPERLAKRLEFGR